MEIQLELKLESNTKNLMNVKKYNRVKPILMRLKMETQVELGQTDLEQFEPRQIINQLKSYCILIERSYIRFEIK